jgi:hypothetical protein
MAQKHSANNQLQLKPMMKIWHTWNPLKVLHCIPEARRTNRLSCVYTYQLTFNFLVSTTLSDFDSASQASKSSPLQLKLQFSEIKRKDLNGI